MRRTAALQLFRATALEPLRDTSDAELLRRFCRDRDEAAFREVFRRYESLVRGASARLTRARHAHAIRHAEALPSWLYRVARSVTARKSATAPLVGDPPDPAPSPLD